MKTIFASTAVIFAATLAAAQTTSEGRDLANLSFESVDEQGRGYVDLGQVQSMGGNIFVSMDGDESGTISKDEFLGWGYGIQTLAEDTGKTREYLTALKIVFALWDRDGDGALTRTEHRKSIIADFERADLNDDAVLDRGEFLGGISVMVALRAALKPE